MRPATAFSPEGPQNIVDSVAVARWLGARGVVAVCASVIHSANDVRKQHTYRLDAFASGDAGPIGYVEKARLRLVRDWPTATPHPAAAMLLAGSLEEGDPWPQVEIVSSHAGADGRLVQSLVAAGVQGSVVAGTGTGNGTIHQALETALRQAVDQGGDGWCVRPVARRARCWDRRMTSSNRPTGCRRSRPGLRFSSN
jgi:L-asparaginase